MANVLMQAIGYDKYDRESSANTTNSRNVYNSKQVNTSLGKVQVDIPRDRKRQFEATVVYKYSQYHKLVELLIEFSKK